nr:hypothetical protein [Tanacetum cinerariifolium]
MQKYTRFNAQSFKDAMICNMNSIGKYMLEIILHQQRTPHLLKQKKLMRTQEDHLNTIQALNIDSLKVDLVVIQNTCSEKEDTNSETASSKLVKDCSLDSATKDVHPIKYKMSKAKERCMAHLRSLYSHLQVLSKEDLKGIRIEHGFKRAFMSLFGQDVDTFTTFWVVNNQFQKFIDSQFTLDYDSQMTDNVIESEVQDDNSRTGNDTDANDADIRPIYDEEPRDEVQLTVKWQHGQILNETSNKAKIKKEIDVLETMNVELEHSMAKLRKENKTLKNHYKNLYDSIKITRSKTIEQTTSLLDNNVKLKAQIQEKVFEIAALKNNLRKLKENSVDTKFAKTSVLGKPVLQSLRNQLVVRQPNAFKSERPQMSKPQFASQVDVNNNLSRPVTLHFLPKRRESIFAKPDHMIASSESRNISKNMPRFSSNDMVHNHYLDEARKKTQERDRNSKTSVMPYARFQSTTDGSKPKPRSNNQTSRSLRVSKSICVTITVVPKADHSKNSSSFSDSKHFVYSTYHKFSPNKTFAVYDKTSPRSDLRWKPAGRIFKFVGLRWFPKGKLFDSCTSKVDSEPPHGSNIDIPNIHECKQTLDVSACTSINVQKEQSLDLSAVPYVTSTRKIPELGCVWQYHHYKGAFGFEVYNTKGVFGLTTRLLRERLAGCKQPLRAQVDQESQIKMIQVKEMMQDKDLKNSKSKDEGSRSRSRSMNDQIHYKQKKTKTRSKKSKLKRHIFNSGEDKVKSSSPPSRTSTLGRSMKTLTLRKIVSLSYIKSNKNVNGLIKSN